MSVNPPQPEWLTATDPDALLTLVRPAVPWPAVPPPISAALARRFRLFACACARTVWELLPTDARSGVSAVERYADRRATWADIRAAALRNRSLPANGPHWFALKSAAANFVSNGTGPEPDHATPAAAGEAARNAAKALACRAAGPSPPRGPREAAWHAAWNAAFAAARAHQAELARDVFPPPGRFPRVEPDWLTSTVMALARQMDASGDFSAVPILADALQDAGCDDEVLLAQCRAAAHCRGNWAIDLVLGRA